VDTASDRTEIIALLDRYAEALDQRRWALLDEVFSSDVEFDFGEWRVNALTDAVATIRSYLDGCGPTQHLLGNYRVQIDGDQAQSQVYVRAFHRGLGEAADKTYEMGGEYDDLLRRTPSGWRSVKRTARVLFETGTREVLGPGKTQG
jgi:3-phenylpropionate/cinnamic acid dioxygenase small subunit